MAQFNIDTNYEVWPKIAQQVSFILNAYVYKYNKNSDMKCISNLPITNRPKRKKIHHYIFSPLMIDIGNTPRNIYRRIKKYFNNRRNYGK